MELDKQIKLGHLLLSNRICRTCGKEKNLIESFYRTRKDRGPVASSYSYENYLIINGDTIFKANIDKIYNRFLNLNKREPLIILKRNNDSYTKQTIQN